MYERPSLELARTRYSVTEETVNDIGEAFPYPYGAVRRNGEIVAYFSGPHCSTPSALQCARENAEKRARWDAGVPEDLPTPSGLFKGPEDY